MRVILDIETDGLQPTKVHCIVLRDADTGEVRGHGPDSLKDACRCLAAAREVIGHNVIAYDLPVLERLLELRLPGAMVYDTLIMARLCWPDVQQDDWARTSAGFPKEMVGRHSLKAWGHRLGMRKDDWGETTDWSSYSPEMLAYCERDTEVTLALWRAIRQEKPTIKSVEIEHRFARIILKMEEAGFGFDVARARALVEVLQVRREELRQELVDRFPPTVVEMKTKRKVVPFNPNSRLDIARGLQKLHGWQPKEFTAEGRAKIDEGVLSSLGYKEATLLLEYLMVSKRLGQLAEGDEAWLSLVKDGRIHGRVNTNGAVTGRCTHSKPNLAQVPGKQSPYGKECRSLFVPREGWTLVGADASSLELRCLAHYMTMWDQGAYAREVVEGDVHSANQAAAGLPTRDAAKTFIYAFLYGAGDETIGTLVGGGSVEGRRLKSQFLKRTPALKRLKEAVTAAAKERGFLVGLDGRRLPVRSQHSALNTLLQSAGAVVMKQATILLEALLGEQSLSWGRDWRLVAHVHDEMQVECDARVAQQVGELAVRAIRDAGPALGFKCRLDGQWRSGPTWSETH